MLKYFMLLMLKYVYTHIKDFSNRIKTFFLLTSFWEWWHWWQKTTWNLRTKFWGRWKFTCQSCFTPEIFFNDIKMYIMFIKIMLAGYTDTSVQPKPLKSQFIQRNRGTLRQHNTLLLRYDFNFSRHALSQSPSSIF